MFNVVLTGRTVAGRSRESSAAALAAAMRVPEAQVLALLAGKETVIKRGLDEPTLKRYMEVLATAGVEARAEQATPGPAQTRTATVAPAPYPSAKAPVETIKCPACGAEQPRRTLCRQCGVDMPRVIAAQAEARHPPPITTLPSGSAAASTRLEGYDSKPFYRRSTLIEVLFFLFATGIWGLWTMLDSGRRTGTRVIGGALFALFAVGLVYRIAGVSSHSEGFTASDKVTWQERNFDDAGFAASMPRPVASKKNAKEASYWAWAGDVLVMVTRTGESRATFAGAGEAESRHAMYEAAKEVTRGKDQAPPATVALASGESALEFHLIGLTAEGEKRHWRGRTAVGDKGIYLVSAQWLPDDANGPSQADRFLRSFRILK